MTPTSACSVYASDSAAIAARVIVFLFSRPLGYSVPTHHGSDEIETCGCGEEDEVFHSWYLRESSRYKSTPLSSVIISAKHLRERSLFVGTGDGVTEVTIPRECWG